MIPLSRALYLWRTERGLTQEELARRAEVSRPNLSGMERGRREVSLQTLRRLASALGITPGFLVDGVGPLSRPLSRLLSGRFSREALERIADAAAGRGGGARGEERELADLLGTVTRGRVSVGRGAGEERRVGKRQMSAAWLSLRSACPPEVLQSLLERVRDRERLRGTGSGAAGSR